MFTLRCVHVCQKTLERIRPQNFPGAFGVDCIGEHRLKLTHTICFEQVDIEERAYKLSKKYDPTTDTEIESEKRFLASYASRHDRCYTALLGPRWYRRQFPRVSPQHYDEDRMRHIHPFGDGRLNLDVLRVCRQINKEAALLPLTNNTFAFDNGPALEFFVSKSLRGRQRAAITRLQLDGCLEGWDEDGHLCAGMKTTTVAMLTGLVHLRSCVVKFGGYVHEGLTQFGSLPINKVSVITGSGVGSWVSRRVRRRLAAR